MNRGTSTLKRSGFRQGRKEEHRSALKAGAKRLRSRQRIVLDGDEVFRSEAYLAAVRTLDCVCCGRNKRYTEAAHSNQLFFGKGGRLKASDATAMALCKTVPGVAVGCHAILDQGGVMAKAERNNFEYKHIAMTALALIREGKLKGSEDVVLGLQEHGQDWESLAVHIVALIEGGQLKVAN
ncbi:MAG TPA: hypothetical protein VEC35_01170 [Noviherbaspirillum sp.]|nr:hypothetical protein [Noviherbaspirillum sp.]